MYEQQLSKRHASSEIGQPKQNLQVKNTGNILFEALSSHVSKNADALVPRTPGTRDAVLLHSFQSERELKTEAVVTETKHTVQASQSKYSSDMYSPILSVVVRLLARRKRTDQPRHLRPHRLVQLLV